MYCSECGYVIPEGTTVCPICNASTINQNQSNLITYNINNEQPNNISSQANTYNNVGKNIKPPKKPVKWMIPCVCVLITLIVGGIGIGIGIKIASKGEGNTEADTQAETTKQQITTSTEATVEVTAETTEEITIEEVPDEPIEISVSEIPEIEKLESFIDYMSGKYFVEFDCEDVSDDFAHYLITIPEAQIADFSIAPNFSDEFPTNDPLEKFYNTAYKLSVDTVNWIEKNVFNLSDSDINRINNWCVDNSDVYESDGYYYMYHGGIGYVGYYQEYMKAKYDGKYYYVTIDLYDNYDYMNNGDSIVGLSAAGRYEYKLELKEVDGVTFWSIYSCRSLTADWAKAYYKYLLDEQQNGLDTLIGAFIIYVDANDIPELFVVWTRGAVYYNQILSYQDGNILMSGGDSPYRISYIEKENLFYESGGRGVGTWSYLRKIENGEFIEIGHTEWSVETDITSFYWDGQEVSEEEYNKLLYENFDSKTTIYVGCDCEVQISDIYSWLQGQYEE